MSGVVAVVSVDVVDCGGFVEVSGAGYKRCAMMVVVGVGEKSGVAQNVAQRFCMYENTIQNKHLQCLRCS